MVMWAMEFKTITRWRPPLGHIPVFGTRIGGTSPRRGGAPFLQAADMGKEQMNRHRPVSNTRGVTPGYRLKRLLGLLSKVPSIGAGVTLFG